MDEGHLYISEEFRFISSKEVFSSDKFTSKNSVTGEYNELYREARFDLNFTCRHGSTNLSKYEGLKPYLIKVTPHRDNETEFLVMIFTTDVALAVEFVAKHYHCKKIETIELLNYWVDENCKKEEK